MSDQNLDGKYYLSTKKSSKFKLRLDFQTFVTLKYVEGNAIMSFYSVLFVMKSIEKGIKFFILFFKVKM